MIPLRVLVRNFLCHGDQVFDFDGHPVWLLHGPNGVGKSAVFDAMLYALFGEADRREGSKTAVADLVRYGESSLRVEFDFEHRGRRYRVWRTRSRHGQPKQGVGEFLNGNATPQPIAHVVSAADVEKWVRATLGLTYDRFVSAVLLRQGAAERLIDADKESRRELFRGIIDLNPYVRLHEAVKTARTEIFGEVRSLRGAVQERTEVTEAEVVAADVARDQAEAAWEEARTVAAKARDRLAHARSWDGLHDTCEKLRGKLGAASERAARAAEVEQQVNRLRELRLIVPALALVRDLRGRLADAEAARQRLAGDKKAADDRLAELTAAAEQERQKADTNRARAADLDSKIAVARAECVRLGKEIEQAEQAADLHDKLARARGKQFAPDLDDELARAEKVLVEAQTARDSYAHLERMVRQRSVYQKAVAEARTASGAETDAVARLVVLEEQEAETVRLATAAAERSDAAGKAVAVALSQVKDARARLAEFSTNDGEAFCSLCLQPIDAEHAARERDTLTKAIGAAEAHAESCQEAARTASAAAEAARQAARLTEEDRRRTQAARDEAAAARRRAEPRATAARSEFDAARAELSSDLAAQVGALDADGFPSEADAARARETSRTLQARTKARDAVQSRCQERDRTAQEIQTLTQAVSALGAPADVTATRQKLAADEQGLTDLQKQRGDADQTREKAERAERELTPLVKRAAVTVNRLAGEVGRADAKAGAAQQASAEAERSLPDGAVAGDPEALGKELKALEAAKVEDQLAALAEDRARQTEWEQQLADGERQIEEQVPVEARCPSTQVAPEAAAAERAVEDAEKALSATRRAAEELARRRKERQDVQNKLATAEQKHALHDRLAGLLSEEGLQLDLVRHAERHIIDLANETLGRVSRGELRFEPPDPTSTKAFDLSVRRPGCPEPIPVRNLSGGQRCRVAVSLALGVCRFACREAQPMQSIIIDEAFAHLDRDGRMAMIDVIRDGGVAGDVLRRIIVVSHHEDVAAAFPVSYRLENAGGVTTATAFRT